MKPSGTKRCDGFSLIETMMAVLILGMVLVSILAIACTAFRYLADIRRRARSSQVLQQRMEDIRLLNWTQLQALPANFSDSSDPAGVFAGTVIKTPADWYHGSATVVEVTLVLTWTNRVGLVQTNTLSTLISNGGLNKYIF